jgi:hypothetical protein
MHPTTLEYLVKAGQDDTRRACHRGGLLQEARRARHASARQPRHSAPQRDLLIRAGWFQPILETLRVLGHRAGRDLPQTGSPRT